MQSPAATVEEYLSGLSEERRQIISAVRQEILKNLPPGFDEGMQYGMIGYYVPHSRYPSGYHCNPKQPLPFANLASQKNYVSVYLYCVYSDEKEAEWFRRTWEKTGCKLNMGKSCVRFRKLEDIPLRVIGQAVKRMPLKKFIAGYESAVAGRRGTGKTSTKKQEATESKAKRQTKRKPAGKKAPARRRASKKPN